MEDLFQPEEETEEPIKKPVKVKYPKLKKWLASAYLKYFAKSHGQKKQRQLAMEIGISETQLSKYMWGTTMPTPKVLDKMAEVLGVGVYAATDSPPRMPTTDPELITLLSENPEILKMLKDPIFRDILNDWPTANKDIRLMLRDKMKEFSQQKKGGTKLAQVDI
jgi:transcriptional regulator with XRE-family HTH domain